MRETQLESTNTAVKLLRYFEALVDREGAPWEQGRDIARRWVMIIEGDLDIDQIEDVYKTLKAGIDSQGTAWYELFLEVRKWRNILSQQDE